MFKIKLCLIKFPGLSQNNRPSPLFFYLLPPPHVSTTISEQSIFKINKILWVVDLRLCSRFIFCIRPWSALSGNVSLASNGSTYLQKRKSIFQLPQKVFSQHECFHESFLSCCVDFNPITTIGNRCWCVVKTNIHLKKV